MQWLQTVISFGRFINSSNIYIHCSYRTYNFLVWVWACNLLLKSLTECVLKIFHICIRFSSLSVISKYQNKKLAYHFHRKGRNCLNFAKFAYRISLYLPPIIRVDNKDQDSVVCSVITRPALIGPDLLCSSRGSGGIVKSANCFDNLSWDCVLCPHNLSPLSDINSALTLESQLMWGGGDCCLKECVELCVPSGD